MCILTLAIRLFTCIAECGWFYEDTARGHVPPWQRRSALEQGPRRRAAMAFLIGVSCFLCAITGALLFFLSNRALGRDRPISSLTIGLICIPAAVATVIVCIMCIEWMFVSGCLDALCPVRRPVYRDGFHPHQLLPDNPPVEVFIQPRSDSGSNA